MIVLIWGFTGILGDQISVSADYITFYRMSIAFASLLLIAIFIKKTERVGTKTILILLGTGSIIGLHWFTFFHAIKLSTVSVGVVCMSTATLFTSIIEPIIFKRKFLPSELILSLFIIAGIIIIFGFEASYSTGIIVGITSAFLASTFTVINGKMVEKIPSFKITLYEMLGGALTLMCILIFNNKMTLEGLEVTSLDWVYLLILGILCTTVAFLVSVWVMKYLTPFTVSMSLNLEPIYTIILALVIGYFTDSSKEVMSIEFYLGGGMILVAIFVNSFLKRKKAKKKSDDSILDEPISRSAE